MRKRLIGMAACVLLASGCNEYLPPTPAGTAVTTGTATFDRGTLLGLVGQAAADNRIPAGLLYAVLQAESGGDPNSVSSHGAMGLMQLMPETAAGCGLRHPFDPHDNLECGASYLSQMLENFHGDVAFAVAAYNVGPNAVLRYHGVPPQSEGYVRRVLALYQTFTRLSSGPP